MRNMRHGKPVIKGTQITVDEDSGMLESNMTLEEVEGEYGLTDEGIRGIIRYAANVIREKKLRTYTDD